MRTIEKVVEVAFVSLFIGAVVFVVVMACTGQVYASHTGLGQQSNKPITPNTMSKILKIEGQFEIIGFFVEGKLVRTTKRRVTNWK